ncbi:AraC family transcriptional regulator [Lachnospiraceae bacterium 54-53]
MIKRMRGRGLYWRMLTAYLLLLFLPVIFMETVNYISVRKNTLNSLEHLFYTEGTKQLDFLEEQINTLQKVTYSARLSSCFYDPFEDKNYPRAVLDVAGYLNDQSPWLTFYSGIFYYNMEKGIVITAKGTIYEENFMNNYLKLYQPVSMKDDQLVFADARNQLNKEEMAIIVPLEQEVSCLIFTVDKSVLESMLTIPGGNHQGAVDLYYGDRLIYSSGSASDSGVGRMTGKDRQLTIESSLFKLDWHFPESVYTEAIYRSIWKQFAVVFLVIAAGVYMIYKFMEHNYKPLKEIVRNLADKLPHKGKDEVPADEVQYLDMVLGELLYSKQFLEESNQELKKEQLLYQLLCSHIQNGSILYNECLKCGIHVDGRSFLCLYMEESGEKSGENFYEYFTEKLPANNPEIFVYSTYYTESSFIFLIASDMECRELDRFIRQNVSAFLFSKTIFGQVVDSADQIHDSYYSLQTDDSGKMKQNGTLERDDLADFYPKTSMSLLRDAVEGEQLAKMGLAVQGIREAIEKAPVSAAMMIYLEASDIIAEQKLSVPSVIEMAQTKENCRNIFSDQLTMLYKRFRMESVMMPGDSRKGETGGIWQRDIHIILNYIEEHCGEKTFSIKSMAAETGTSPSNLSHYFKKCTGQNISKYIDSVRMKRAVNLLEGSSRIADVAEELGYNSTSVFIETFKRVCGITPSQYRQEKNQLESI